MKQNRNKTKKDETGNIYGQWAVLSQSTRKDKSQRVYWTCECSCGTLKDVLGTSLRNGTSTCCGCTKPCPKASYDSLYRKYYRSYQYGSKRKTNTYDFLLTFEEYLSLVKLPCYYCGQEPYDIKYLYNRKSKRDKSLDISTKINGIDRVDNSIGYVLENCVACCKMCNLMKLDNSESNFLKQIKLIYEHRSLNEKISYDQNS